MVLDNSMIKPRPLPKGRLDGYVDPRNEADIEFVDELILAEAYWREAVKKTREEVDESDGCHAPQCFFCNGQRSYGEDNVKHDADCPWLLAQEE